MLHFRLIRFARIMVVLPCRYVSSSPEAIQLRIVLGVTPACQAYWVTGTQSGRWIMVTARISSREALISSRSAASSPASTVIKIRSTRGDNGIFRLRIHSVADANDSIPELLNVIRYRRLCELPG